jgi:hypothetical protein
MQHWEVLGRRERYNPQGGRDGGWAEDLRRFWAVVSRRY